MGVSSHSCAHPARAAARGVCELSSTTFLTSNPTSLSPVQGTLCTYLLGDNVALLIRELFLCHLLPWNILKLIPLELEKGNPQDGKWEFG
jgi:hypothetical protein